MHMMSKVSSTLITARPKIQKWVSDSETEDPEFLDTSLQINDQIDRALARYGTFTKGEKTFASNPIPQQLSNNGIAMFLIDLDNESSTAAAPSDAHPSLATVAYDRLLAIAAHTAVAAIELPTKLLPHLRSNNSTRRVFRTVQLNVAAAPALDAVRDAARLDHPSWPLRVPHLSPHPPQAGTISGTATRPERRQWA
ncbi:hypothetical protein BDN70DRAFT_923431 [Pholiota conissans]|uniref:GAT domain-containing protein n=1 Tax=Pholiota conissans TaxID=109636 RepID=A0A9P5YYK4_9AGAR|nr:hypothetical protein BDN70DRAFT_923431 [Pholiota conissans]